MAPYLPFRLLIEVAPDGGKFLGELDSSLLHIDVQECLGLHLSARQARKQYSQTMQSITHIVL